MDSKIYSVFLFLLLLFLLVEAVSGPEGFISDSSTSHELVVRQKTEQSANNERQLRSGTHGAERSYFCISCDEIFG